MSKEAVLTEMYAYEDDFPHFLQDYEAGRIAWLPPKSPGRLLSYNERYHLGPEMDDLLENADVLMYRAANADNNDLFVWLARNMPVAAEGPQAMFLDFAREGGKLKYMKILAEVYGRAVSFDYREAFLRAMESNMPWTTDWLANFVVMDPALAKAAVARAQNLGHGQKAVLRWLQRRFPKEHASFAPPPP